MEAGEAKCAICNAPGDLKCSACKSVSYCSKDHQKKDWKTHKNSCRAYEVCKNEKLGVHLVAARDILEGSTIIQELPLVTGPKTHTDLEAPSIPCVGCYMHLPVDNPPARCMNCGWPACATHCPGLENVKEHGTECPVLKLRGSFAVSRLDDFYRYYALTPLRCLLLQKRDPKKWRQLMEMEAHMERRGPKTEIFEVIEENIVSYLYTNYICPLKAFENQSGVEILKECSKEIIHKVCGIIDVNSLDLHLSSGNDITGLYPTACLMEHRCVPNTKHIFDETDRRIRIIAAQDIKKGEHISTMYTHALWGTAARRNHLQETKYFSCECERCKDPTELGTYLSALKCVGSDSGKCEGYLTHINPLDSNSMWKCGECGQELDNEAALFLTAKLGDEVDDLQMKGPSIKELETMLEKFLHLLHPHHYHVYGIKHSLVQLIGYQQGYLPKDLSDEQIKRKMEICRELIEITDKIDPYACRLSLYQAVSLHELHLAQFEYVQRKWADQCREVERGPFRDMLKECRELLVRAQKILELESVGSAGYRLVHDVFANSVYQFEKFVEDFRVNI